ncbi:MAG TPA: type II secretion system F family protein [Phycisphaerae bacterium]|nr:type II secretion system F family protein [Phycisphaerae bacterium]
MTRTMTTSDQAGELFRQMNPRDAAGAANGPVSKGGFAWLHSLCRNVTGEAVSTKLLLVITSQLAVMLASGCDLCAGLEALSKQQAHPTLKKILADLHERVKQGQSFSQALSRHPDVFSDLYVTMVRAGESAGLLKHMLQALQVMIRNNIRIVSSIRGALMYPVILLLVAITAITVMTTFVLPRFAKIFEASHTPLPTTTKFVIGASQFLSAHFAAIGVGIFVLVIGGVWLLHHPAVRDTAHKMFLRIPLLGKTLMLAYVCRSIQTLGMLIKSGLPLADALVLTRDMMPNIYYWRFFDRLRTHIGEGKQLSSDFDSTTLFPPMVTQMISVGEQTGTLAQVCIEIATFHEEELQERIKILTTALEPIIIVLMGGFVGFIAVSVILPMFKLSSTVH